MHELGPSSAEPERVSEALLLSDPVKYGNMLYGALSTISWNQHFKETSKDEEVKAVCRYCSELHPFMEDAFDELFNDEAQPGRAKKLWDDVKKEEFTLTSLITLNLHPEDLPSLMQEKKQRQRAIAHSYALDKQALILVNEMFNQANQKTA